MQHEGGNNKDEDDHNENEQHDEDEDHGNDGAYEPTTAGEYDIDLAQRLRHPRVVAVLRAMTSRWNELHSMFLKACDELEQWDRAQNLPLPCTESTRLLFPSTKKSELLFPIQYNARHHHQRHTCLLCLLKEMFRDCVKLMQLTHNEVSHGMAGWAQVKVFESVLPFLPDTPVEFPNKKRNFAQFAADVDGKYGARINTNQKDYLAIIAFINDAKRVFENATIKLIEAKEEFAKSDIEHNKAKEAATAEEDAKEAATAEEDAKEAATAEEDAKEAATAAEEVEKAAAEAEKAKEAETAAEAYNHAEKAADNARLISKQSNLEGSTEDVLKAKIAALEAANLAAEARALKERAGRLAAEAWALKERAGNISTAAWVLAVKSMRDAAAHTCRHVSAINAACIEVNGVFIHLASLGNETAKSSRNGTYTLDVDRFGLVTVDARNRAQMILDNPQQLNLREFVDSELMDAHMEAKLDEFYRYLSNGFRNAKLAGSKTLEADIEKTVEAIHNKPDNPTFYVPGNASEEKGWQPILNAIMYEVDMIVNGDPTIIIQQKISGKNCSADRRADIGVGHSSEHLRVILPFMSPCTVEVKPLCRTRMGILGLHGEGFLQVTGHLARELHHYFHLGELGVDQNSACAVLTVASIEIVEMELGNFGSSGLRVDLRKSGIHLLFDQETTEHLFELVREDKATNLKDTSHQVEEAAVAKELGISEPNVLNKSSNLVVEKVACKKQVVQKVEFMEIGGRSLGFHALAKLLRDGKKEDDMFTSKGNIFRLTESGEEREIEKKDYLGNGMFGSVYKVNDNLVVKLPKSFKANYSLHRECEILRILKNDCIPNCDPGEEAWCTVAFEVRCERTEFKGLLIRGIVGKPATTVDPTNLFALDAIARGVRKALEHAHDNQITHLDVRPKNIIYVDAGIGKFKVQLIDWGCGSPKGVELPGFRGSLPFAHDDLLLKTDQKVPILPMFDFDWASLSFTMAALLNGNQGHPPWWGFYKQNLLSTYLKRRHDQAQLLINESSLLTKKQLLNGLPEPPCLKVPVLASSEEAISEDSTLFPREAAQLPFQEVGCTLAPLLEATSLLPSPPGVVSLLRTTEENDDSVDVNPMLSRGGSADAEPVSSQGGSTDAESESS